jgi:hypothetical protein
MIGKTMVCTAGKTMGKLQVSSVQIYVQDDIYVNEIKHDLINQPRCIVKKLGLQRFSQQKIPK